MAYQRRHLMCPKVAALYGVVLAALSQRCMAVAHLASFELVAGIHISSANPDILELAAKVQDAVQVRKIIDPAC